MLRKIIIRCLQGCSPAHHHHRRRWQLLLDLSDHCNGGYCGARSDRTPHPPSTPVPGLGGLISCPATLAEASAHLHPCCTLSKAHVGEAQKLPVKMRHSPSGPPCCFRVMRTWGKGGAGRQSEACQTAVERGLTCEVKTLRVY